VLLKTEIEHATANEILEEINTNIISNNIKIDEDDLYIIPLIESTIKKAILDYVQHAKQNYQREYIE
jgi:hypothetical protein